MRTYMAHSAPGSVTMQQTSCGTLTVVEGGGGGDECLVDGDCPSGTICDNGTCVPDGGGGGGGGGGGALPVSPLVLAAIAVVILLFMSR